MSSKPYFDEIAQQWDKMREGFFSEAVREKALAVAGVQRGMVAADLGAGTGFITEGLVREGLQVIAVDESEAMLETMRKKFSSIEGIDYRVGEAENLPIPNGGRPSRAVLPQAAPAQPEAGLHPGGARGHRQ